MKEKIQIDELKNLRNNFLQLSGGTLTGSLNVSTRLTAKGDNGKDIILGVGSTDVYVCNVKANKYLQLRDDGGLAWSGNSIYHTGYKPSATDIGAVPTSMNGTSQSWINGAKGIGCMLNMTSQDGYSPIIRQKTTNGAWTFGAYTNDVYYLTYCTNEDINASNNKATTQYQFHKDKGGIVYTTGFKPSANDVGALPKTGGDMTGTISFVDPSSGYPACWMSASRDNLLIETAEGKSVTISRHGDLTGIRMINGIEIGPTTGSHFNTDIDVIPVIKSDGAMEVGRIIDFHAPGSSRDWDMRFDAEGNAMKLHTYPGGGACWLGFYRGDTQRYGFIGNGATNNDDMYITSDLSNYVRVTGNLVPSGNRMYWLGTNSPQQQWKGLCAEGGTVGSSDINCKENMFRLDGSKVIKTVTNKITTLKPRSAFNRASSEDYYSFFKDRFNPTYYNYRLVDRTNTDGDVIESLSKEQELKMLKNVGFIAQDYDLESDIVAKEFMFKNEEGEYNYNHMSYVTSGFIAMQQAIKEIENLKAEIALLKESI